MVLLVLAFSLSSFGFRILDLGLRASKLRPHNLDVGFGTWFYGCGMLLDLGFGIPGCCMLDRAVGLSDLGSRVSEILLDCSI